MSTGENEIRLLTIAYSGEHKVFDTKYIFFRIKPFLSLAAGRDILLDSWSIYPVVRIRSHVSPSIRPGPDRRTSPPTVEFLSAASIPAKLQGRRFDFIVAMDLLDKRNCAWMMQRTYDLLEPGGQILFYESNPWNLFLRLRRTVSLLFGNPDPRSLLSRPELYELISEIGFIRIPRSLTTSCTGRFPDGSCEPFGICLSCSKNMPVVRTMAGSILVHGQKPPRTSPLPKVSLFEHEELRGAISVVVPCHNEEMNIRPLVERMRDLFGEYLHEIIPVDDNSTDNTREVIEQLAEEDPRVRPVFRRPPHGVGRAIMDGYRAATGRYVLSMDCDFQHLLPEIRDIFDAAAQGYEVVVGGRFSRMRRVAQLSISQDCGKSRLPSAGTHCVAAGFS